VRILIVAPPWLPVPPPAYGGTETVLDGLARGLKAAGHDVLLYTTGEATCPVERGWFFEQAIGVGNGWAPPRRSDTSSTPTKPPRISTSSTTTP